MLSDSKLDSIFMLEIEYISVVTAVSGFSLR